MNSNQKTILFLRTDLGTKDLIGGGSVAHTLGVIKGLLHHGHRVICASSAMHKVLDDIDHPDFVLIKLHVPNVFKLFGYKINCLISNLIFYYKVEKLIKEHTIDLIYQRYSMLNLVGTWLYQKYSIPFILEFNGSESWVDAHWSTARRLRLTKLRLTKLRLTRLIAYIEQANLEHAQSIIVVSQVLKEQLIDRDIQVDKIQVNPNGVDIKLFNPAYLIDKRKTVRNQLMLEQKFVIGFSGTFSYWHGVEVLSFLIPKVIKQEKKVHFLLMGDGPLKKQLAHIIKHEQVMHGVTFTDMLHTDQMPAFLAACDAYICPTQPNKDGTRFFGSPTKLFEYMAMGKPIIASRLEQIAEILTLDNVQSLLVESDDYEGFAQAVIDLIHMHHQQCDGLGRALQQRVQQYSWHEHVQRILDMVR